MQRINPICKLICIALLALGSGTQPVAAQNATSAKARDEQAIRSLIQQENEGKRVIKYTDEAIFVSGAYPRPAIGAKQVETMSREVSSKRSNESRSAETVRLVLSKSRDLAYEFGNFKLSFDDSDGKKVNLAGSYLRVWRKVDSDWKVDAFFARPNRDVQ